MAEERLSPQTAARVRQAAVRSRRVRSLCWCFLAAAYGFFAYRFAARDGSLLDLGSSRALVSQVFLLLLLPAGFGAMGILGQGQRAPLSAMGLPRRAGAGGEFALGAALGWAAAVAAVLPPALLGGMVVTFHSHGADAVRGVLGSLAGVLLSALVSELLFRGYAFQRLLEASGPMLATLAMLLAAALWRGTGFPRSSGSLLATVLLNLLLAMAYLRTRALWVGFGLHFAWNASLAVVFGVPVSEIAEPSPVISTYTRGAAWLAGGDGGPEGSLIAVLVLLVLLWVLARVTQELRHRWALPPIIGAGIPVDIDAAARRQHEKAMGDAPAQPALVQIAPALRSPTHPESLE